LLSLHHFIAEDKSEDEGLEQAADSRS
jgi:hypothetical protein